MPVDGALSTFQLVGILLGWVLAMVLLYVAITRWSRFRRVRERVLDGERTEPDELVEYAEHGHGEGFLERWLALAGFRRAGSVTAFLLAWLLCIAVGLALALGLFASGLFTVLADQTAGLPAGLGDLIAPVLIAGPWILLTILVLLPILYVRGARKRRVQSIESDLPITLDLLATLSESGLGFDSSMSKILDSETRTTPLVEELKLFQLETLAGIPRISCFRRLSDRVEVSSMTIFCSAMVQAEQVGSGFSNVLRHQADDLRARRRERAMVQAQALSVKLVFPLVICFLPGIFLGTLGPAFHQFFEMAEGLIWTSGGG